MRKKYQISAIIYDKKGKILSVGQNSYVKTHPIQADYAKKAKEPKRQFLHAEIDAIIKCKRPDKAYRMYVFRHDEHGVSGNAKPCAVCQLALSKTNIKFVEFSK